MHSLSVMRTAVVALVAIASTGSVSHARTATFIVNSTADDPPGPCETVAGGCTLREAIIASVANPGRDTIGFDPAVFPLGAPATIQLGAELPAIADPAGTIVDGAGAGVALEQEFNGGGTTPIPGLLFATAPGVPLANVTVANLTVRGFPGIGVHVCGGVPPDCQELVTGTTVHDLLATENVEEGIKIEGRVVTKVRIADSVGTKNGRSGIQVDASPTIAGVQIERCAAHDNERQGILVGGHASDISDAAITNSIATHNRSGIVVAGSVRVAKVKLTDLGAVNNESGGIVVDTLGQASAIAITNSVASGNPSSGIEVLGDVVTGVAMKDVAGSGNGFGIFVDGSTATDVRITRAKAVGNEAEGMALFGVSGATVTRASVVGNGGVGLRVNGSGNVVERVRASENDQDGIRVDGPGGGNRVELCSGMANQGPGISVQAGSTANTLQNNVALGNDAIDLFDANVACGGDTWKKNVFENRDPGCIQ